MRVTGGIYSGRTVRCPKGVIRPSMDRMRESVFSILGNIEGLSFLDLFSGSGIIGIEAASRGASPVVLVEKDFIKKNVIRENYSFVESDISLRLMSVERYIQLAEPKSFNLIFLDPPFPRQEKKKLIDKIGEKQILRDGGILMIHYPAEDELDRVEFEHFRLIDKRKYGRSIVLFFRNRPDEDHSWEQEVENTEDNSCDSQS
ncbi:MAG: 16S rRNA (guanine(966)-N(2))-methyltransferase RsmD [Spirochaetia bacterium]|nr:16S rRNA (guanine(966)-N(2))-methyltransferase RsmD [Spirochaetia bacterium]